MYESESEREIEQCVAFELLRQSSCGNVRAITPS